MAGPKIRGRSVCILNFYILIVLSISIYFCRVNVIFIDREGIPRPVRGKVGDNLMYLAHRHAIELEGN